MVSGQGPDGPGYTGHENDTETGLVYMQARYYDPVGRFLSPDPIGPGVGSLFGFNRYDYANNNPIINTDPMGMSPSNEDPCSRSAYPCQVFHMDNIRPEGPRQVTSAGIAFIKGWEHWNGVYDKKTRRWLPKDDGFGNGTIGWGHNCGLCKEYKNGITKAEGDALLKKDLAYFEDSVTDYTGYASPSYQFDALVDFALNVRSYRKSTLMHNVALGRSITEKNFTSYGNATKGGVLIHVPSLYLRREREWLMYNSATYNSRH